MITTSYPESRGGVVVVVVVVARKHFQKVKNVCAVYIKLINGTFTLDSAHERFPSN